MKFDLQRKEHPNLEKYYKEDLDKVYRFANELHKELGGLIRAVVIFGSTARRTRQPEGDIDVLVVIDDTQISLTPEVTEAYRVIVQRLVVRNSTKLHIITLRFTNFWEYIRNGDPVAINILRDGVALIDSGFFDPLQVLLKRGRIRPTQESIWTYYMRSPNTLNNSKWRISQAVIDLYWAVIDAAHAALMKVGETPPSPDHVADMLQKRLVDKRLLEAKYVKTMRTFYRLMKLITHREIKEIKGEEYDRYYEEAEDFVNRMRKIIDTGQFR
ncbi:TPA: nucleotidyltransferase domain-containing protein [Candidatus Woesearchaeota archaeon]|nr:nucleotidyltransferase domain-containing protein [Candidatus Woesearchaeota archaeon]HIJ18534.1 nucleotidyltransferase domain-containing protein [Candidatus Woesearchaeota archaeon]